MKRLLIIFVFYISYIICADEKYAVKSFPKKVKLGGSGKILINSGKYVYKTSPPGTERTKANESKKNGKYTVFQVVGNSKAVRGVPDSPYFPVDQSVDHKPRVKKVLPDYIWSSLGRHKRSADEANADETPTPKGEKHFESVSVAEKPNEKDKETKSKLGNAEPETHVKKEEAKNDKKETSKHEVKREAKIDKKGTTISAAMRAGKKGGKSQKKEHLVARGHANKPKSKTRLRGKSGAKNATAVKKLKSSAKGHGRPKTKQHKKSQKTQQLKHKKSHKRSKSGKSKKQSARKGKTANIKIPKETRRLTAAREALIEDYPYVVSIQKDGDHWCSGALLNPRLVITTANCLWKANRISRMQVRAGSSYTDHGGQLANIQEVMKHPRWGLRKNPDSDVALVLLDRNIRFSHAVHGVDLPNRAMLPAFEDAWVASWGSERRDGIFDEHENALQVYHTFVMSNESCNNVTQRFGIIVNSNFICFTQSGKTSPCTRDTGAPAVSDGVLWGLASWGIRKLCGTERFPSVFSYIASHSNMDFIANATSYLMSDERHYPFVDRPPMPRVRKIKKVREE